MPPPPSSLPFITVALCASAKKHHQSFDALRVAGELHNARLREEQDRFASVGRPARSDLNGGLSASASLIRPEGGGATATNTTTGAVASSKTKSRGGSRSTPDEGDRSTPCTGGCSPRGSRGPVRSHFFRFVNLNYDALHHSMVVCTDDAVKGTQPPPMHGEEEEGTDVAMSASEAAAAEATRVAEEVDVVLHKVATFGTPSAIRALERWCKHAQKRRRHRRQAPLVVLDPLEKVQLLMTRNMLYKLLDNTGADGRYVALIPRTFLWDRPCAPRQGVDGAADRGAKSNTDDVVTPIGIHSFMGAEDENIKEARANGTMQGRWWIAKPDEGTGPAFTHHLVMWCTRAQDVRVPPAVQAALPKEANRFILQELYVYALPVIVKVYCIAPHIYIRVKPTVNLLAHLWERTRASTLMDVAVTMDSQDKTYFSSVTSLSAATSRLTFSQATSGADYGTPAIGESTESPVTAPQELLPSSSPAAVPWESMVAPTEMWEAFLAPGTPAYATVSKLAQEMSGFGGIGLTMYGFDILLVPQHLAHTYQRKSSRGIGHTEGATVKYEAATSAPPAAATNTTAGAAASAVSSSTAVPSVPLPCKARDMFDFATGAPTSLLLDSIPVVIDVNYFPGYKDVEEANQHMMELLSAKVAKARDGTTLSARRSDDLSGSRDKKHLCTSM
ncbi:hypothetical protein ABB37_05761 [Leptomonas pyrrhocoris]|uniref:Uncharacterized protein n=1 Tax=Leptomonas pyrrhocoris TaxID=157538 RepID=A0A0M9FZV0_LEPPY|nr:hypothetical protein ABB37_05761 [Leptomonas pyrrhocoris]XP_015657736.1 hypothetical protein ABB37_05761 [Leptomonas pyrrhocoris]KPA79296.1 hypothetical protein ABB37_05761 [Leptomonas pyrrhocoris]KPA79297.1 hypothetical protein ABB37_05761 [Leptomonas pyrrhocoris]|eukprot:XP_015657735.1 hypothetical protein ABB37_05761 [Leptomonas pyrrhocoris]